MLGQLLGSQRTSGEVAGGVHTVTAAAGRSTQSKAPAQCPRRKIIFVIQRKGMQASYNSNNHDNKTLCLLRALPLPSLFHDLFTINYELGKLLPLVWGGGHESSQRLSELPQVTQLDVLEPRFLMLKFHALPMTPHCFSPTGCTFLRCKLPEKYFSIKI